VSDKAKIYIIDRSSEDPVGKIFDWLFNYCAKKLLACEVRISQREQLVDREFLEKFGFKYHEEETVFWKEYYPSKKDFIDRLVFYSPLSWFLLYGHTTSQDLELIITSLLSAQHTIKFECQYKMYVFEKR
jgi:hypothetical protein